MRSDLLSLGPFHIIETLALNNFQLTIFQIRFLGHRVLIGVIPNGQEITFFVSYPNLIVSNRIILSLLFQTVIVYLRIKSYQNGKRSIQF